MSQRFRIDGRLMGRNEHDYLNRSHWSRGKEAKRSEQDKVCWAIKKARLVPMGGPVEIGVNYIEGRKKNGKMRDVDNIASADKVILDALVECGVIPDDDPKTVRNVYHRFAFNASNPHVEVEVMEYSAEGRTVYYPPVQGLEQK